MSLAAWYAPRGLTPTYVLAASETELMFLLHAKNEYIKEQIFTMKTAILAAFDKDIAKEVAEIYG